VSKNDQLAVFNIIVYCKVFASKIQLELLSKKPATKFLYVKTSSSTVVATSFPYLMAHKWIAGDVPI